MGFVVVVCYGVWIGCVFYYFYFENFFEGVVFIFYDVDFDVVGFVVGFFIGWSGFWNY